MVKQVQSVILALGHFVLTRGTVVDTQSWRSISWVSSQDSRFAYPAYVSPVQQDNKFYQNHMYGIGKPKYLGTLLKG